MTNTQSVKIDPIGSNQHVLTTSDGTMVLFSYRTPVALLRNRSLHLVPYISKTTTKHVNAWVKGLGHLVAINTAPSLPSF